MENMGLRIAPDGATLLFFFARFMRRIPNVAGAREQ